MSLIGILKFLIPVRRPGESGAMLAAAWRSARTAAEGAPPVLDGRAPSRMLRELRRTVILAAVCAGIAGAAMIDLYLGGGSELQVAAALVLTAMFAIAGIGAWRRARAIARWLDKGVGAEINTGQAAWAEGRDLLGHEVRIGPTRSGMSEDRS